MANRVDASASTSRVAIEGISPKGERRGGLAPIVPLDGRLLQRRRIRLALVAALVTLLVTSSACARSDPAEPPTDGVVGVTPVPATRLFTMEDHGYALPYWVNLGIRGATVVHLDSHDDFRRIPDDRLRTLSAAVSSKDASAVAALNGMRTSSAYDLGDFLYGAAKTGVVSRVVWVVPEQLGTGDSATAEVKRRLTAQGFPASDIATMRAEGKAVSGRLFGVPVTVTPLDALAAQDGTVLLDIDMDYFTLDLGLNPYDNATGAVKTLVDALRKARVRPAAVTIATSTEGGYLPLQYRWLTDLLTLSLSRPAVLSAQPPVRYGYAGEAIAREQSQDMTGAAKAWRGMTEAAPRDPAGWFGLGRGLTLTQTLDLGSADIAKAAALDPTYQWGYVQLASELSAAGRPDEALRSLDLAAGVDPSLVSLKRGDVLYNARRYAQAADIYRKLSGTWDHPDVWMFLGDSYAALGREADAERAYAKGEQALGRVTFRSLRDYPDALPYLAKLAEARGDRAEARKRYSLYLELRPDGPDSGAAHDALGRL